MRKFSHYAGCAKIVAGPAHKKSLEAINENLRSVLERIFQHMTSTELDKEGMASSSSKSSTMDIREFTLFLSQVCLSTDISATAHKIFRGVMAARVNKADKLPAGHQLGFEDFLKCVRLVAADADSSVGDLVMPLLPQLAGQASQQLISMHCRSRALAHVSGELMLTAQTVRAQDIGRLVCWLQEVACELVSCDSLSVYVVRQGGALVSSWVKVQKVQEAICLETFDAEAQAAALTAMFEQCSKGDGTNILQAIGSRSKTISFREFRSLLEALKLLPQTMTMVEAGDMFGKVNNLIDASDSNVHELSFEEFETLMHQVADKADTTLPSLLLSHLSGIGRAPEDQGPQFEYIETRAAPSPYVRDMIKSKKPQRRLRPAPQHLCCTNTIVFRPPCNEAAKEDQTAERRGGGGGRGGGGREGRGKGLGHEEVQALMLLPVVLPAEAARIVDASMPHGTEGWEKLSHLQRHHAFPWQDKRAPLVFRCSMPWYLL